LPPFRHAAIADDSCRLFTSGYAYYDDFAAMPRRHIAIATMPLRAVADISLDDCLALPPLPCC